MKRERTTFTEEVMQHHKKLTNLTVSALTELQPGQKFPGLLRFTSSVLI